MHRLFSLTPSCIQEGFWPALLQGKLFLLSFLQGLLFFTPTLCLFLLFCKGKLFLFFCRGKLFYFSVGEDSSYFSVRGNFSYFSVGGNFSYFSVGGNSSNFSVGGNFSYFSAGGNFFLLFCWRKTLPIFMYRVKQLFRSIEGRE